MIDFGNPLFLYLSWNYEGKSYSDTFGAYRGSLPEPNKPIGYGVDEATSIRSKIYYAKNKHIYATVGNRVFASKHTYNYPISFDDGKPQINPVEFPPEPPIENPHENQINKEPGRKAKATETKSGIIDMLKEHWYIGAGIIAVVLLYFFIIKRR